MHGDSAGVLNALLQKANRVSGGIVEIAQHEPLGSCFDATACVLIERLMEHACIVTSLGSIGADEVHGRAQHGVRFVRDLDIDRGWRRGGERTLKLGE